MLPAPYPPDTRARGWRLELDHEQFDADAAWAIAAQTGQEARPLLLMQWLVAWRQTPCGSLPTDEAVLAALIGINARTWAKYRDVLLRDWWTAADGRQYHPMLTARVLEMLRRRRSDADRQAARRASDANATHADVTSLSRVTPGELGPESSTGTGTEGKTKKTSSSSSARPTIPCPYEEIVAIYHAKLPDLPRVRLMPEGRQRRLRKAWGWILSSTKSDGSRRATTAEEALTWLGGYFGRAATNDFLMGRTPRSPEHSDWRCDLDYLLTDRGMKQVIEKTQEAA